MGGTPTRVDMEQAWARFEARAASEAYIIKTEDVPFVTTASLQQQLPPMSQRQDMFKKLAKRWHPDKWRQRYSQKMAHADRDEIMHRVKESFQVVQQLCNQ